MDTPDLPPHFEKLMVEPIDQKARTDILQFVEQQIVEAEEELRRFKALREILKEATGSRGVPVAEPGGNEAPSPGPLEVIDENAGKCCRKALESARLQFFSGRDVEAWNCPTCATEFRREMVGPVAHWRIVEHFAVVRPR